MSLDAIPTTDLFDTFTKTLCVGYDNVPLVLHFMVSRLGIVGAPIINLSGINNNIGKFNLSHIRDRVLLNTKSLILNNHNNNNNN